jgi:dihydroflavonol-4-reductase
MAAYINGITSPRLKAPPAVMRVASVLAGVVEKIIPLPPTYSRETLRVSAGVTYLGDNRKAKRELGYNPRPLAEGLRETLDYYMRELEIQP